MAGRPPRPLIVLVLIVAAAGGYWWWQRPPETGGDLTLQGNVEVRQVNLGFKVAGRIKTLDVDEGDPVFAGKRLAVLDPVYFEDTITQLKAQRDQLRANLAKLEAGNRPEEIAQAEAAVAERQAALDNARLGLDRAQSLMQTASGTRKAYDDAQAAYSQTQAQLNSARQGLTLMQAGFRKEDIAAARAQLAGGEAQLKIAERQLSDAGLYAPSAGIVLTRARETGAIVNTGETVFVLSLTSPVWVRTYVSETDLGRIRPGEDVSIKTDTAGLALIKGHVGFVSPTAEFTPKTVETRELRTALVYRIRIVADDPQGVLRQGMPVTVTFPTATAALADTATGR
ncbi:MAG: secretion protein HlyD [Ancalomicrobiaceae bacterium]|nr:secretion protein HlyD [Ancalomicrobiaceae bacterium]